MGSRFGGALLELNIDQTAEVRRGLLLRCRELVGAKRRAAGTDLAEFLDAVGSAMTLTSNDLRETQWILGQIDQQCPGGAVDG